ncbi:hypothetical protein [Sphingosinithalassobacter portus]|uniref:hypothetical protein n=1 Tax=Stakelama portus TaxID=2676234 RepID=UPI000D6E19F5|nr:hypothetical protein [Sphingosinithalassobacter portus]
MILKFKYPMLALPLALAVSACGSPQATNEEQTATVTADQPGFENNSATPSEARSQATTLADRLASGNLNRDEATAALEQLDGLINDNMAEFPEDMRTALAGDIQSARDALATGDMGGLQEAATQIQNTLSGAVAAPDAG